MLVTGAARTAAGPMSSASLGGHLQARAAGAGLLLRWDQLPPAINPPAGFGQILTWSPDWPTLGAEVSGVSLQVNVREAKTNLSRLLARVSAGEEIIIARGGKPIARLVPVTERPAQRIAGSAKGKVSISADFDAPLPGALLEAFEQ